MRPQVLLTRPESRSAPLAARLSHAGIEASIWPVIDIRTVEAKIDWSGAQAVILTSAHAVDRLKDAPDLPAICVGPATADAARAAGFSAVTDAGRDVDALRDHVCRDLSPDAGALIYPRARDVARDLPTLLAGFEIRETVVYAAEAATCVPPEIDKRLSDHSFMVVAFFSPRSAAIFAALARGGPGCTTAVAISRAAAAPLADAGFARTMIADAPNGEAMYAAICSACEIGPDHNGACA